METRKCRVIVDGKECGLDMERDETEELTNPISSYRCALGHRTHVVAEKRPNNQPGGRIRDRHKGH